MDGQITAQNCGRDQIKTFLEVGSERLLFSLTKHNFCMEAKRSCEAQRSDMLESQGTLFSSPGWY